MVMKTKNTLITAIFVLMLGACSSSEDASPGSTASESASQASETMSEGAAGKEMAQPTGNSARLAEVLAAQSDELKARYPYRHPQETLEFFGIEPGMTVVEVLPGRGWYSPILVGFLGAEGQLIGADYPLDMWANFTFADAEFIAKRRAWVDTWPEDAAAWQGDDSASVAATRLGEFSADQAGTVDAVLFIRALHNLNRFEEEGQYRSNALKDTMMLLKPGGLVGVVQHSAPEERGLEWADGSRGYLNKGAVIAFFEDAGFELVGESDVNANPADVPAEEDIVWRLPPSLNTSRDNPDLRAKYEDIGESNRMTLLFRKPA
jgi:predicted methyltransferase